MFLEHVDGDRLNPLWLLYASSGLRRGEALALRWSDLDLQRGYAAISRASVTAGYRVHQSTPKTDRDGDQWRLTRRLWRRCASTAGTKRPRGSRSGPRIKTTGSRSAKRTARRCIRIA